MHGTALLAGQNHCTGLSTSVPCQGCSLILVPGRSHSQGRVVSGHIAALEHVKAAAAAAGALKAT